MANQQVSDVELGWLAGILDGEGWIGFSVEKRSQRGTLPPPTTHSVKVEIKVNNTDRAITDKVAQILRKLDVNPYERECTAFKDTPLRKRVYEVSTKHMVTVQRILSVVVEHLVGNKKERAKLMLRFIELRKANPGYRDPKRIGRSGDQTIKPYTEEEWLLVTTCRALQSTGASETAREAREKVIRVARATSTSEAQTSIS